jgi:RsiW-degrading membrane proteinase PrsW (M82 family)
MAISTQRLTRSTVLSRRYAVIIIAIVLALAVNLVIYAIGRAAGGAFTYTQSGRTSTVDAVAITFLSTGPLTVGLTLVAILSRRWPVLINAAKIASPALALATIALMTIPAHFDTTSTMFLASMHLTLIPISVLALTALAPSP